LKQRVGTVDGSPDKRLLSSVIADYDLNRAVCELVDNAIDTWSITHATDKLRVRIRYDESQKTLQVTDNAGGVPEANLGDVVGPGRSRNKPTDPVIGIFGIGTMRAVVALAQDVRITTRFQNCHTYQMEFSDLWLTEESWNVDYYRVDDLPEPGTVVDMSRLRVVVDEQAHDALREYLQRTYAKFLIDGNASIVLGSEELTGICFNQDWAYPRRYRPRIFEFPVRTAEGATVDVKAEVGVTRESSPSIGEYGVYVYCNKRLVARALKTIAVGFSTGHAGRPHPQASLARVIVSLDGPAYLMPWNSSKSDVNTSHVIFVALQKKLVELVTYYASLSRRLMGRWKTEIAPYGRGKVLIEKASAIEDVDTGKLPPLPSAKPRFPARAHDANKRILHLKPWTQGLCDNVAAAEWIFRSGLKMKNRLCLILLDSIIEIALKDYMENVASPRPGHNRLTQILNNRHDLVGEAQKHLRLSSTDWTKIDLYYRTRCDLIHRSSVADIPDSEIEMQRSLVHKVLKRMFSLTLDV
jgi:hypothetical protein